jgi:hypothetical protein
MRVGLIHRNPVGVVLAAINLALWALFLVVRTPIAASDFARRDAIERAEKERAERSGEMSMSVVTDQPFVVFQRPVSVWGDVPMHVLMVANLPATFMAFIVNSALGFSHATSSLARTYVVGLVFFACATVQWLMIGFTFRRRRT